MTHLLELKGDGRDAQRLIAMMMFPSDRRFRELLQWRQMAVEASRDRAGVEKVEVPARLLRALLLSPSNSEINAKLRSATRAGVIAGDLLSLVYVMAQTGNVSMPSINKAVHMYLEWARSGATFGDGKPLPKSESTVREAWANYKSVSHFWAAIEINVHHQYATIDELLGASLGRFLAVSAGFLKFGCSFVPARQKPASPILQFSDCVRVIGSTEPELLPIDGMPERFLRYLKTYKAPQPMG